ncbi:MAG: XRE family transcriptional regulator [Beijerinckiaceae bacterium]|nr:XRE family transcriptional regulator [Beijerinckiaceae bacterium]
MITGAQIRAARGLLRWTAKDLAEHSGTNRFTIQRLEQSDGIPPSRSQTLADIKRAFEEAGVEFIGSPQSGAGVRFKSDAN